MRRLVVTIATAIACAIPAGHGSILLARPRPGLQQANQPTFHTGVDLVQVDVSVLDKRRLPVRGLAASDFTLLEDGKPRPIVAFSAIDLPDRSPKPAAPWMRDIVPDIATNDVPDEGRLVVIVMDRTIPEGLPTITARNIAKAAIDALGPGDLAAVVYTGFGVPQDFTADRTRLRKTVDASNPAAELSDDANEMDAALRAAAADAGVTLPVVANSGACYCGLCVLETITRAADAVRDVARRRKSLLFIGRDITINSADADCGFRVKQARETMFRSLDLANVTVHALDPSGLETLAPTASSSVRGGRVAGVVADSLQRNVVRQSNLGVLPDRTGGRTIANTNDADAAVREVFRESDSYYLLGFEPADRSANGRLHDIKVSVNRPGLDVRTRHGYLAAAPPVPPSLTGAIAGLMPNKDGITLNVGAASFPDRDRKQAIVALMLVARHTAPEGLPATGGTEPPVASRNVNVLVGVFSRTGQPVGSLRQTLEATPRADANDAIAYEIVSRLPLRAGHYELRIGVEDAARHQTGSVYTFIDVPDYSSAPLAMSDVVLQAPFVNSAAGANTLGDLLPVVPTARRDFSGADRVSAFVRVSESGSGPVNPVPISARVVDQKNRVAFDRLLQVTAKDFEYGRTADVRVDLPMSTFAAGAYLLTIEAKAGKSAIRRDVRFSVK